MWTQQKPQPRCTPGAPSAHRGAMAKTSAMVNTVATVKTSSSLQGTWDHVKNLGRSQVLQGHDEALGHGAHLDQVCTPQAPTSTTGPQQRPRRPPQPPTAPSARGKPLEQRSGPERSPQPRGAPDALALPQTPSPSPGPPGSAHPRGLGAPLRGPGGLCWRCSARGQSGRAGACPADPPPIRDPPAGGARGRHRPRPRGSPRSAGTPGPGAALTCAGTGVRGAGGAERGPGGGGRGGSGPAAGNGSRLGGTRLHFLRAPARALRDTARGLRLAAPP